MIEEKIALLIPILTSMLQVIKTAGFNVKYIPLMALLFGFVCGLILYQTDYINAFITGATIGFSAIGIHSGIKNTIEK
jgi:hypothetical protein